MYNFCTINGNTFGLSYAPFMFFLKVRCDIIYSYFSSVNKILFAFTDWTKTNQYDHKVETKLYISFTQVIKIIKAKIQYNAFLGKCFRIEKENTK